MIEAIIAVIKTEPLQVTTITVLITIFTFIAIKSELKHWRINKTLKYFRDLKHEQQQLLYVLKGNKEPQYKEIACYNYLDEQEKILNLMANGKLQYSLFNDLIKPMIIESINMNIVNTYIIEINKENLTLNPNEISYPLMFQFIMDNNNDRVNMSKEI